MSEFSISYSDDFKKQVAELIEGRPVLLASGSPRRQEILRKLGVDFSQCIPGIEEDLRQDTSISDPVSRSIEITRRKALKGSERIASGIVVAADTIVVLENTILPKPKDRAEAADHLARLAGKQHCVHTSLVLIDIDSGAEASGTSTSRVTFKSVKEADIARYVATGEPDDKAGAYGIQGMGKFLVDKFTGNLDNIVGFPVQLFVSLLEVLNGNKVRP